MFYRVYLTMNVIWSLKISGDGIYSCKFTYCEITVIHGVPIFVVFVGRPIYEIRIQRTMNLVKQLDIDILKNAVLEWPRLSGSAAQCTIDNLNDEISTNFPFNRLLSTWTCCELFDCECMRKTTEMFLCVYILTTFGNRNQIYFQTIHWRWHPSKYYIYHGSYELTYLSQRIRRMCWLK